MIGAIAGDIVGSRFEHRAHKSTDFELFHPTCRFTDDTVMTIATADAFQTDGDFGAAYHRWGRRYPNAGYGGRFRDWLASNDPKPYNSWGNGSAMRVSPVASYAHSEREVLRLARKTALPTHNHPRGIIGAQAIALATWLSGQDVEPEEIRRKVAELSGYDLTRSVDQIRPGYRFDVSCDGSVPEAIICGLEASSWEDAVRKAVSLGGDADTQAAIAGGMAGSAFGLADSIARKLMNGLIPTEFRTIVERYADSRGKASISLGEPIVTRLRPTQSGEIVISSNEAWVKVVEMLQQNWAFVEPLAGGGVTVYFVSDISGVFDQMIFDDESAARSGLIRNGFVLYGDGRDFRFLPPPPEGPYRAVGHPNGPIYSSGRYWNAHV